LKTLKKFINRNYIQNFNQHDIKFKNNAFKIFLQDKESFDLAEETIEKLNFYSQDFPINEINYNLNGKIYTSHEGLLLKYEECFVRKVENQYYNLSGHLLWIGILKYNTYFYFNQLNFNMK